MTSDPAKLKLSTKHKQQIKTTSARSRYSTSSQGNRPRHSSNAGLPSNATWKVKKTFTPVATGGVNKQNQDEIIKKEKEARKIAKEQAARTLASILTKPEQLVQVEQQCLEKNDSKRLVSGTLKNLIKSKLDDVQTGIFNMDEAISALEIIRSGYFSILGLAKDMGDLIPKEHYELIQEVNIARNNLLSTREHLVEIIDIPRSVALARELMADDINILEVHQKVRKLQRARSKILTAAQQYTREARQLEEELAPVVTLANEFNAKIRSLAMTHFNLARKQPAVLIKVLQVINREMKMREASVSRLRGKNTTTAYRRQKKFNETEDLSESFSENTREDPVEVISNSEDLGTTKIDETEWVLDLKLVSEWIKKACVDRFNGMFDSCKEKGKYSLSKCLDTANDKLFDDLTHVFDELRPCFPPWLDIFSFYCKVYHSCLNKMLKEWGFTGVISPDELLDLAKWISSTYEAQMLRLGANKEDLVPPLTEELSPLLVDYENNIRKIMTEWALRLIEQDRLLEAKLQLNNLYYTTGPTNLFQILHSRIDMAFATTSTKVVLVTAQQSMNVLKKYQEKMSEVLRNEGPSWDPGDGYVMALINNFSKCYEYSIELREKLEERFKGKAEISINEIDFEGAQKGFQDLVVLSRQILITQMLKVLSEEISQLFTKPWATGELNSCKIIVDTLKDYFDDISQHVEMIYSKKIALETMERLTFVYVEALFTKRLSFDNQVVSRLDEDIDLLQKFGINQTNKDKAIKSALQVLIDLKEFMNVEVSQVKYLLDSLLKHQPDFREDMAEFMIDNRDNMDRADKKLALAEIKAIYQKRAQAPDFEVPKGVLSHLELPGGFLDNLMKEKKSEKKDNK